MKIRFWGVRGSVPVPGPRTLRIGGNTSCIGIETPDVVVILDAGTGIIRLGQTLATDTRPIVLLTSHCHWDHMLGFPFFAPLWQAGREIHVVAVDSGGHSPLDMLDGHHFPKHSRELPSKWQLHHDDGANLLARWGVRLTRQAVNHPGGGWGFRIQVADHDLTYLTDHELDATDPDAISFEAIAAFARDTDLLVHDAQFSPEERMDRCGWGHSDIERVCELARAANAHHLVLFHHDPMRDDNAIMELEAEARDLLAMDNIACTAAWEGLEFELACRPQAFAG
jgi:phosphoribosyl 1,2-cyclic phosphodiesterase